MEFTRKHISQEQYVAMLEFMKEHPALARARCRKTSSKYWALCAHRINYKGGGPAKSAMQWAKIWADWKYRARKKAMILKGLADGTGEFQPEDAALLTPMEEDIIKLVGDKELEDVILKRDPLNDGRPAEQDEASDNDDDDDDLEPLATAIDSTKIRVKKERSPTPSKSNSSQNQSQKMKRHSSGIQLDSTTRKKKHKASHEINGNGRDSDDNEEIASILRLEKQKLESTDKLTEAVVGVKDELSRVADELAQIKELLRSKLGD